MGPPTSISTPFLKGRNILVRDRPELWHNVLAAVSTSLTHRTTDRQDWLTPLVIKLPAIGVRVVGVRPARPGMIDLPFLDGVRVRWTVQEGSGACGAPTVP